MKVLFIDQVHEVLAQRLSVHDFECIDASSWSKEECIEQLEDIEGIVIRSRFPMNEEFLSHASSLKFIARSGAGMENIDVTYTEKNKIICFNAPEGNRNAVGEHALGMLLTLFNRIHLSNNEVRDGQWKREANRGIELDGKKIGIIGYGNNGSAFAKKLRGFDVEVLAYDKYLKDFGDDKVKAVSLSTLFETVDVVSFHIPQNEETLFMGDTSFFDAFKKNIYVINCARGKIIRTSALVEAMKTGKVLGACLDVLEYESSSFENAFHTSEAAPLNYLLQSPNVVLTPHVAGWTKESYFKLSNVLADKILNHDFEE